MSSQLRDGRVVLLQADGNALRDVSCQQQPTMRKFGVGAKIVVREKSAGLVSVPARFHGGRVDVLIASKLLEFKFKTEFNRLLGEYVL
jgi:hypothetical protein